MRFDNNTRSRVVERLDIVNVQVQENDNEETESVLVNVSKTIAMSYCTELQLRVSQPRSQGSLLPARTRLAKRLITPFFTYVTGTLIELFSCK